MLEAARGTFSLGVAVCSSPALARHLIDTLRAEEPGTVSLQIPGGTKDVYGWLCENAAANEPAAIFLTGLEESAPSGADQYPAVRSLNATRERWPRTFTCPIVFWVPEYVAALISTQARDFWAWKSHEFYFVSELARPEVAIQAGAFGGDVGFAMNLPAEQKRFRIAELEQRLGEAGDVPSKVLAPHVLAWLNELGGLRYVLGDMPAAIAALERALQVARAHGHRAGEAGCLGNLGLAYAALGEARRAIEFYEQHLEIARKTGDRRGEEAALGNLGNAYSALGEVRRAIEFYEQALTIDREIGDRRGEGQDLGNLGNAYARLGEARRAIEFYEQALAIAREIGDRQVEGNTLGGLGLAYAALGETRRAIEFHEQALAIAREIGDRRVEGNALGNLGSAYAALGEAPRAIELYEQALEIDREIGDKRGEGTDLWNMALEYEKMGDRSEAVSLAAASLEIKEAIEDPNAEMVRQALRKWQEG